MLLLDESLDLLLAPTLLALAPLAKVVIPALSPCLWNWSKTFAYLWNWSKTFADDVSGPVARFHPGGLRHVLGTFVRSRSRARVEAADPRKSRPPRRSLHHFYRCSP